MQMPTPVPKLPPLPDLTPPPLPLLVLVLLPPPLLLPLLPLLPFAPQLGFSTAGKTPEGDLVPLPPSVKLHHRRHRCY